MNKASQFGGYGGGETHLELLVKLWSRRQIGHTTAMLEGVHYDRPTILIVANQSQAKWFLTKYSGSMRGGNVVIGDNLMIKTIFDIPTLLGRNEPVLVDHFAMQQMIIQHTAALNKHWREKYEELKNTIDNK